MPNDTTPPGDALTRRSPEPAFPEPKPQREQRGEASDAQSDGPRAPQAAPSRVDPLTGVGEDVAG